MSDRTDRPALGGGGGSLSRSSASGSSGIAAMSRLEAAPSLPGGLIKRGSVSASTSAPASNTQASQMTDDGFAVPLPKRPRTDATSSTSGSAFSSQHPSAPAPHGSSGSSSHRHDQSNSQQQQHRHYRQRPDETPSASGGVNRAAMEEIAARIAERLKGQGSSSTAAAGGSSSGSSGGSRSGPSGSSTISHRWRDDSSASTPAAGSDRTVDRSTVTAHSAAGYRSSGGSSSRWGADTPAAGSSSSSGSSAGPAPLLYSVDSASGRAFDPLARYGRYDADSVADGATPMTTSGGGGAGERFDRDRSVSVTGRVLKQSWDDDDRRRGGDSRRDGGRDAKDRDRERGSSLWSRVERGGCDSSDSASRRDGDGGGIFTDGGLDWDSSSSSARQRAEDEEMERQQPASSAVEEETDFDRSYYDADEDSSTLVDTANPEASGAMPLFTSEKYAAREAAMERARARGEAGIATGGGGGGGVGGGVRGAKRSALHADQQAWEANRLLTSGVVDSDTGGPGSRGLFAGDQDADHDEQRVHLLVHHITPPFLAGKGSGSGGNILQLTGSSASEGTSTSGASAVSNTSHAGIPGTGGAGGAALVSTVRDPASDIAQLARRGSEALRRVRQEREKQKVISKQKFWELGGSRMGAAIGLSGPDGAAADAAADAAEDGGTSKALAAMAADEVEGVAKAGRDPTDASAASSSSTSSAAAAAQSEQQQAELEEEEEGDEPRTDYKKGSQFSATMKGLKLQEQAVSEFARTRTIAQQRAFLPVAKIRSELMQVIAENQIIVIVGETGSGKTTQVRATFLPHAVVTDARHVQRAHTVNNAIHLFISPSLVDRRSRNTCARRATVAAGR